MTEPLVQARIFWPSVRARGPSHFPFSRTLGTHHSFVRYATPHSRYRLETVSVLIRTRAGCTGGVCCLSAFKQICSGASERSETPPFLVGDFCSPFVFMITLFFCWFSVLPRCSAEFYLFEFESYVNGVSFQQKSFPELKINFCKKADCRQNWHDLCIRRWRIIWGAHRGRSRRDWNSPQP